jgi:hypothetical protein
LSFVALSIFTFEVATLFVDGDEAAKLHERAFLLRSFQYRRLARCSRQIQLSTWSFYKNIVAVIFVPKCRAALFGSLRDGFLVSVLRR